MDLKTHDPAGTAAFFSQSLGWHFAVDEDDWRKATKISVDGHLIGGVSDLSNPVYPPDTPDHIAFYLAVDDVDRRAEAAVANGARLVVPPFEAGDQGRMATLVDPFGAAVSLWQARTFTGWKVPPGRMVLACDQPDEAPALLPDADRRPTDPRGFRHCTRTHRRSSVGTRGQRRRGPYCCAVAAELTNTCQAPALNPNSGPAVFLESRTRTTWANATSTHAVPSVPPL
ncbi:hypothetical protein GCM10022267_21400 [Lentzea roselyniae]|uniref:VOC domain-containing protein n=1 Tax=Lentzea roselyniae TaxID=531940 RepID=A0ABP7AKK3_9PSEU